jgi:alpha-tubulin suppressor-like RCC1 family protein
VSAGENSTCGVTTGGTEYCWGANGSGELGDGTIINERSIPAPITSSLRFRSVATAKGFYGHTCATTFGAGTYCWGANGSGQLGDGTTSSRFVPVVISGFANFVSITAGWRHSCAAPGVGNVSCWGNNEWGQLGDGTTTQRLTQVTVAGAFSFSTVGAGGEHTCAVREGKTDDAVYCWGRNASGQLGDGSTRDTHSPVAVHGGLNLTLVTGGESHTCGYTTQRVGYCWGANAWLQLSDSSPSYLPVRLF